MYFAIIDASSDISRIATVAYGQSVKDIALWFADEFDETLEMYADPDELGENQMVLEQARQLGELADDDALEMSDLDGMVFSVSDISVELYGVYDNYGDFQNAFVSFVSDKPKYVKIIPEETPLDFQAECDRLNTLLVRASI